MTTQPVTQRTDGGTGTRLAAVAVAGALAIVVTAVSVATWRGARPGSAPEGQRTLATSDDGSAAALARRVAAPVVPVTDQEMYERWQQRTQTAPSTVYITVSQEQAVAVRADLDETNAQRAMLGLPPLVEEVIWFDSAEAEVQFWARQHVQQFGTGARGAPSALVDLRGPSPAP
jgi:hypothetical protein